MFTSGFFNAVDGDRAYDAEQVSAIFDGIITDGIIKNYEDAFAVTANGGNNILVGAGRAWHKHTWSFNDSPMSVAMDSADTNLGRIDAVVLEINRSDAVRSNSIKIVKGTAATSPVRPTMENTVDVLQLPLAYITRPAGAVEVSQANITSMIGTESCPYARPIIDELELMDVYKKTETYSRSEMDSRLAGKSATTHNHDDRYPTMDQVERDIKFVDDRIDTSMEAIERLHEQVYDIYEQLSDIREMIDDIT